MLADPVRLERFVSALAGAVKVDNGFNLVGLADEMRGLHLAGVSFTTVPLATASYVTPTGQDAVLWDAKAASALFTWVKNDTGTASPAASKPPSTSRATISRAQVSVDVYNGTLLARPVDGNRHEAHQRWVQRAQGWPELAGARRRPDAD